MEIHDREEMVRVLAARFPDYEHASQALESLQERLDNEVEAEIAPLASYDPTHPSDALLAGHFPEAQRPEVVEIVEESGGEIVADVDERWTLPRQRHAEQAAGDPSVEGGQGFSY